MKFWLKLLVTGLVLGASSLVGLKAAHAQSAPQYYTFRSVDGFTSTCYTADSTGKVLNNTPTLTSNCTQAFVFLWDSNASQPVCYAEDSFGYAANRMDDTIYDSIYCINNPAASASPML